MFAFVIRRSAYGYRRGEHIAVSAWTIEEALAFIRCVGLKLGLDGLLLCPIGPDRFAATPCMLYLTRRKADLGIPKVDAVQLCQMT